MFDKSFQGAPAFEILSPQGANPTANWKVNGVKRLFDKTLKGYVFHMSGMASMKLCKEPAGLIQPILVLQIYLPQGKPFSMELGVTDVSRTRRRLLFSSSFKEMSTNPLHARFPLVDSATEQWIQRDCWINLCFDMDAMTPKAWPGQIYKTLDSVQISQDCRLRKIYTVKSSKGQSISSNLLRMQDGTRAVAQTIDGTGCAVDDMQNGKHSASYDEGHQSVRASGAEAFGYDEIVRRQGKCGTPSCGQKSKCATPSGGQKSKLESAQPVPLGRTPKADPTRKSFADLARSPNGDLRRSPKADPTRKSVAADARRSPKGDTGKKSVFADARRSPKSDTRLSMSRDRSRERVGLERQNSRAGESETGARSHEQQTETGTSNKNLRQKGKKDQRESSLPAGKKLGSATNLCGSPTRRRSRPNLSSSSKAASSISSNLSSVRLSQQKPPDAMRSMRYSTEAKQPTGLDAWDAWEDTPCHSAAAVPSADSPSKLLEQKEQELAERLRKLASMENGIPDDDVVRYGEEESFPPTPQRIKNGNLLGTGILEPRESTNEALQHVGSHEPTQPAVSSHAYGAPPDAQRNESINLSASRRLPAAEARTPSASLSPTSDRENRYGGAFQGKRAKNHVTHLAPREKNHVTHLAPLSSVENRCYSGNQLLRESEQQLPTSKVLSESRPLAEKISDPSERPKDYYRSRFDAFGCRDSDEVLNSEIFSDSQGAASREGSDWMYSDAPKVMAAPPVRHEAVPLTCGTPHGRTPKQSMFDGLKGDSDPAQSPKMKEELHQRDTAPQELGGWASISRRPECITIPEDEVSQTGMHVGVMALQTAPHSRVAQPFSPDVVSVSQLIKAPPIEECIDVMFDPLLDIYYDPATNKYYKHKEP